MKRRLVVFGALLALVLGVAPAAQAQMGAARGRVLDELGQPLADVAVELQMLDGGDRKYDTRTDAKGAYTQTLPPGQYRITASLEGYRGAFVEFEVKEIGATSIPDLELAHRERAQRARMAPILEKFNRAGELTRSGELDQAQKLLEELAAEHPEIPEVQFNLGSIHSQKKEWDAAEAAFRKVLELKPDNVPAAMALSTTFESTGRIDEAIALRAKVAEENPGDVEVQYSLALLCLNAQRMDQAGTALERVVALDPERADAYYLLGSVALNKGDMAAAVPHLERYLELAPADGAYRKAVEQILPSLKASLEEKPQP